MIYYIYTYSCNIVLFGQARQVQEDMLLGPGFFPRLAVTSTVGFLHP